MPLRWLPVRVHAPRQFTLGAMHIPNQATGLKGDFHAAVSELARHWRSGPGMLVGDTNTGRTELDEQSPVFGPSSEAWMVGLEAAGWHDVFRQLHGERCEYTWYSPNAGNGFRLDQAFVHRSMLTSVRAVRHEWGTEAGASGGSGEVRRDALSDHAALIVDFEG
jgi:exonuclease III